MSLHWEPIPELYPFWLRGRVRRGRGIGERLGYKSFLDVRDVPSRGTSAYIAGIVIARFFVMLSNLETTHFLQIERRRNIADVRENWPIFHLDRTVELCNEYHVRHVYRGHFLFPFPIDFLITEMVDGKIRYRAESIKTPEDAADPEVRLRLLIEELWCREHGIEWCLVDTSEYTRTMLSALRFMRAWFKFGYVPNAEDEPRFANYFMANYRRNVALSILVHDAGRALRLSEPKARSIFRYCAWSEQIPVSLKHRLAFNWPLVLKDAAVQQEETHATAA